MGIPRLSTIAIVASAGIGKRLGAKMPKPFVLLGGKPLVAYALGALEASGLIDGIIIAAERSCIGKFESLVKRFGYKKIIGIVAGGATRAESVRNCLRSMPPCDIVLVQDAARPFLEDSFIKDSVRAAARYGGAVVAVPESDTVKIAGRGLFIKGTLDRSRVFRAQTPQAFRYGLLMMAYDSPARGATDDASLVERLGKRVKIVAGSCRNMKITTDDDLRRAEAFL